MRTVYCCDCGKTLHHLAWYKNTKRCRSCDNKCRYENSKEHPCYGRKLSLNAKQKIGNKTRELWVNPLYREKVIKYGEANSSWRGGSRHYYGNVARIVYCEHHANVVCENCGSMEDIVIHHINEDRKNNNISNLQALCRACHCRHHRPAEIKKYVQ